MGVEEVVPDHVVDGEEAETVLAGWSWTRGSVCCPDSPWSTAARRGRLTRINWSYQLHSPNRYRDF